MKITNKFIGISGATLMALSAFNASASYVLAETTNTNAKVENTTDNKQVNTTAPSKEDTQKSTINKNSSIGPGYYSANAGFQNIAQPSIFMMFYMAPYQTNFLNEIKPGALAGKAKGVLPSITAAQAIIESGWGTSQLSVLGKNLFGIKGSYNGQSIMFPTKEYAPGRGYYEINAAFRKYPSWAASVEDHANFFVENSRYHNILGKTDYHEVARLIKQDGYATAPDYAQQLINAIDSYGLAAWDKEAAGSSVVSTPVGTVPEPENIAQIVYKPGYGVLAFQNNGQSIAGSNYKFKDGTRWKVAYTKVINGEEMYLVGNNTYIPKKYTTHYDNGVITIHYQPNYGVNALHADGTQVQGSNKIFKTGTRWKVTYTRVINGEICYLVGPDQYIPKKYTQWGKGE